MADLSKRPPRSPHCMLSCTALHAHMLFATLPSACSRVRKLDISVKSSVHDLTTCISIFSYTLIAHHCMIKHTIPLERTTKEDKAKHSSDREEQNPYQLPIDPAPLLREHTVAGRWSKRAGLHVLHYGPCSPCRFCAPFPPWCVRPECPVRVSPKARSEEAHGLAHRRLDVQALHVLPVLLEQRDEEVDGCTTYTP